MLGLTGLTLREHRLVAEQPYLIIAIRFGMLSEVAHGLPNWHVVLQAKATDLQTYLGLAAFERLRLRLLPAVGVEAHVKEPSSHVRCA